MVLLSVYGTVYNNARTVAKCVYSISRVMSKLGIDWEIVVTDNYSEDGTFELLCKLSKYFPVKVLREKCTRGKGRDIALRASRGYYVMYVDFDTELVEDSAITLIEYYLNNIDDRTVYWPFGFTTRNLALKIGGWRDLNHGEDTEFFARACLGARLVQVLIPAPRREEWTQGSRRGRYVKNKISYILRLVRDRIDSFRGCAPSYKCLKEVYIRNSTSTLSKIFKLILYFIAKLKGIYKYCSHVRNNELVLYRTEFLFPDDINLDRNLLFFKYNLRVLDENGFKMLIIKLRDLLIKAYEKGYDKLALLCSLRSGYIYLVNNISKVLDEILYTEHHSSIIQVDMQYFDNILKDFITVKLYLR